MESQAFLLNGPHMDFLRLTCSEFQCWSTRDIHGGTELSGIRVRAAEAAFSPTEVLEEAIIPFWALFP